MQPRSIFANDSGSSSANGSGSQKILSGTPTVGSTVPAMVANNPPVPDVIFAFSGTYTATAEAEISEDGGATWIGPMSMTPIGGGNAVTTTNAPGIFSISPGVATNARARCVSYSNGSMLVSLLPGIPPDLPSPPAQITLVPVSNSAVNLIWNPVQGALTYDVWRGTATGNETVLHAGQNVPTYADTGLANNTEYFYYVKTNSVVGQSGASAEVFTFTLPRVATSLAATGVAASIGLTWVAPTGGATSYNVYRGLSAGAEYPIPITNTTALLYTDSHVVFGTTYYYVVKAVNSIGGESLASNEVSASATGQVAPTSVLATAASASNAITWVAATGALTYNLYRGLAAGHEGVAPIATGLTGTSHTDPGLDANLTYYYTMTALSTVGQSIKSNETSARPVPAPPTDVMAVATNDTTVVITWTAAHGAATYNLYRGTTPGGESGTPVATGLTGTTTTDTVTPGTYYYRMKSVNVVGASTTYSNESGVVTGIINLVLGGDSRFAANGPAAPDQVFDTILTFLSEDTVSANTAVNSRGWLDNDNGGSTLGVISQFQSEVAPLFDNTLRNVYCIACDVNDYAFWPIGQVAGAAYTGIQLARATGFEVVLNGPIDAIGGVDNTPPKDWHGTDRLVLQGYYVTDNTVGADQSLDVFGDVVQLDDASNPTYFADGVHPTVVGSTLWGDYLGPIISVTAGGSAAIANHTIFQDTFADTNGVHLNAHVPTDGTDFTGTPWIYDGTTTSYQIQSNKAQVEDIDFLGLGFALAAAEVGSTDVLISAVVNFGTSAANTGLVVRHVDSGNFWVVVIKFTGMFILERVSGSFVLRGGILHTFTASTGYPMTLQTQGPIIQATADSVSVTCVGMTTSLTKTQCGLYADATVSSQTFDTYLLKVNPTALAGPYTLVTDHFTGTNDTPLADHAPNVGTTWVPGNPDDESGFEFMKIESNKAALITIAAVGFTVYFMDVFIKDYTVSMVINGGASGSGGLVFRYTDINNFWVVYVVPGDAHGLSIYQWSNGVPTKKAEATVNPSVSTAYNLALIVDGATAHATLSGGDLGSPVTCNYDTMASNLTATKVGILGQQDVTVTFDDFVVTNP